eukprot:scaffold46848_cov30-Tisochrysis_lutea.AAC.2
MRGRPSADFDEAPARGRDWWRWLGGTFRFGALAGPDTSANEERRSAPGRVVNLGAPGPSGPHVSGFAGAAERQF